MIDRDPISLVTRRAYLGTSILKTPFWTIYGLMVFILYKDLHASPIEVAVFLALKPIVSLLSVYWSAFVTGRHDLLKMNVILGGILGYLPFLVFPWVHTTWFLIFSGACYMMFTRGVVPAWLEILKLNIAGEAKEKTLALASSISYLGGVILPVIVGDLLDVHAGCWKYLFPFCAILGLTSIAFQLRIPIGVKDGMVATNKERKSLLAPWQNAFTLCRQRRDFFRYQIGFFIGGMGLMLMQPALPGFFFDQLHLSYSKLSIALSVCKGVGFALASKFWAKQIRNKDLFLLSSYVTILAAGFTAILLFSNAFLSFIYIAYFIYGVMQSGSELSWHMSGPIFAREQNSSCFSSVNLAMVGIRGCIAPFLGTLLCSWISSQGVLCLCMLLGVVATLYMQQASKSLNQEPKVNIKGSN